MSDYRGPQACKVCGTRYDVGTYANHVRYSLQHKRAIESNKQDRLWRKRKESGRR